MKKVYDVHVDDLGDFVRSVLEQGFHKITLSVDTTGGTAFNHAIARVTVHDVSEQYDRFPVIERPGVALFARA